MVFFTIKVSSVRVRGPCINCLRGPKVVHLSYQKDKLLLLPIIQWDPLVHNSSLLVMADQVLENPCLRGWFLFKYFLLRVSAHNSPLQFLNLEHNLVVSDRFFCFAALIPKPPSSLWLVTLSQPTRWIFLLTFVDPQIKFLLILSRALWILVGRIVPCII